MSFPTSYNTSSFLAKSKSGNVPVCVFGDSLISGQPSTAAQGWDNLYYGLCRNWSLSTLRGFTTDLYREGITYTPSPAW